MRRLAVPLFLVLFLGSACGDEGGSAVEGSTTSVSITVAASTTAAGPANPAPNTALTGALETVPGIAGTISFAISETGQITEMTLDGGLTDFDCGGGQRIVDSGTTTYFFPDPIIIAGGRFSLSRSDLDWDGVFDSATSVRGNIRLSGGPDCQNRPLSVTWSATAEG